MDWANERYVRVYVRDTVNWKLLKWEGQTVLLHVVRKLDRAGVLDLGGVTPLEAIEALTDLPPDLIEIGYAKCLARGVFAVRGDALVMPNFIDAQEASQSDAERARASRERRRDKTRLQSVTDCDKESRMVVTDGDETSHAVTACHSVPSVPSEPTRAVPSVPSGDDTGWNIPEDERGNHLRAAFAKRYEAATGMQWSHAKYHTDLVNTESWCVGQAKREECNLGTVTAKLVDNFFRDEWAKSAGYPFGAMSKDPGKYYQPPEPMKRQSVEEPMHERDHRAAARDKIGDENSLKADIAELRYQIEGGMWGKKEDEKRAELATMKEALKNIW